MELSGRAVKLHHIPNAITVLRLLLVPPVVALILAGEQVAALILFLVAGVSDGVDGFLARHFHWRSRMGALLDPLADKLLLLGTFVALTLEGLLPVWLLAAAVLRDAVILGGAAAYRMLVGRVEAEPLIISKINTVLQILLALLSLLPWDSPEAAREGLLGLQLLTLVTILGSGAAYVLGWSRRAAVHWRHDDS